MSGLERKAKHVHSYGKIFMKDVCERLVLWAHKSYEKKQWPWLEQSAVPGNSIPVIKWYKWNRNHSLNAFFSRARTSKATCNDTCLVRMCSWCTDQIKMPVHLAVDLSTPSKIHASCRYSKARRLEPIFVYCSAKNFILLQEIYRNHRRSWHLDVHWMTTLVLALV